MDESAPSSKESVPRSTESAPNNKESVPRSTESAPSNKESVPRSTESAPSSKESIPRSSESAPNYYWLWQWSGGDDGGVVAADNDYGDRDVGGVFLYVRHCLHRVRGWDFGTSGPRYVFGRFRHGN